jgi:hypothetical protein
VPVALIDVSKLRDAALRRAQMLWRDHGVLTSRWTPSPDPVALLAMVWTAQSRELDCPPDQIDLGATADKLHDVYGGLHGYLEVLLEPTTLVGQWREALWGPPLPPFQERRGNLPKRGAEALVHAQRLVEEGGLRIGDQVRVIPPGRYTDRSEYRTTVRQVYWHPTCLRLGGRYPETFDVGEPPPTWYYTTMIADFHLLLADEDDPRALAQVVVCAIHDLHQVVLPWPGLTHTDNLQILARRAGHYTAHPQVTQILDRVLDAEADEDAVREGRRALETVFQGLRPARPKRLA